MMIWNKQEVRMKRIMVIVWVMIIVSNRMKTILRNRFRRYILVDFYK
jgi:hypothetical protein